MRKLTDGEFCSAEHRQKFHDEQEKLALARLLESRDRIAESAQRAVPSSDRELLAIHTPFVQIRPVPRILRVTMRYRVAPLPQSPVPVLPAGVMPEASLVACWGFLLRRVAPAPWGTPDPWGEALPAGFTAELVLPDLMTRWLAGLELAGAIALANPLPLPRADARLQGAATPCATRLRHAWPATMCAPETILSVAASAAAAELTPLGSTALRRSVAQAAAPLLRPSLPKSQLRTILSVESSLRVPDRAGMLPSVLSVKQPPAARPLGGISAAAPCWKPLLPASQVGQAIAVRGLPLLGAVVGIPRRASSLQWEPFFVAAIVPGLDYSPSIGGLGEACIEPIVLDPATSGRPVLVPMQTGIEIETQYPFLAVARAGLSQADELQPAAIPYPAAGQKRPCDPPPVTHSCFTQPVLTAQEPDLAPCAIRESGEVLRPSDPDPAAGSSRPSGTPMPLAATSATFAITAPAWDDAHLPPCTLEQAGEICRPPIPDPAAGDTPVAPSQMYPPALSQNGPVAAPPVRRTPDPDPDMAGWAELPLPDPRYGVPGPAFVAEPVPAWEAPYAPESGTGVAGAGLSPEGASPLDLPFREVRSSAVPVFDGGVLPPPSDPYLPRLRMAPSAPESGADEEAAGEPMLVPPPVNRLDPVRHFWRHAPADLRWLSLVLPLVILFGLHHGVRKIRVDANSGGGIGTVVKARWDDVRIGILRRAAIEHQEDFRSGLSAWDGRPNWSREWKYDLNGSVRPGVLALYQPSVGMADYRFEFLGQIESKALSWVYRAADLESYYVTKIVLSGPKPLPTASIVRYAVIDGKEGPRKHVPLPIQVRPDTMYRVRMDVHGPNFTTWVQGQVVDFWSDDRLQAGGVGFFAAKGEVSLLRWVEITHQYDILGRLCAFLAPYSMPHDGSWNQ